MKNLFLDIVNVSSIEFQNPIENQRSNLLIFIGIIIMIILFFVLFLIIKELKKDLNK